jgi:cytochrome c oxidase subunit 2
MTLPLAQLRAIYDRDPSMFAATGVQARRLATLGWTLTAVGVAVFVIVMALLLVPLWRRRGAPIEDGPPGPAHERAWVLVGGALVPALILAGMFVATLSTQRASAAPGRLPITIEVVGHQWWWEVRYPQQGIVTADEMHVPVGRPVRVVLESVDVIHSFWLPNVAGKTDAIPGSVNTLWLEADTAGVYRGMCAEYCGVQHAHMALSLVAEDAGTFQRWVESERAAAPVPSDSAALAGQRVFMASPCAYCHQVRGTDARARVGPDLTHVASRLTLAGGTLPNTRGNLAGWILNPDRIKPGTKMPSVSLDGAQLEALVAYLETLK